MIRRFSYSSLQREDRGVDKRYATSRALRRMTIAAALLSVPFWLALGYVAGHALYLHFTGGR